MLHHEDFPAAAPLRDRLIYLLRYAVLAPSTHNTQPWRFRVREHGVDVYADVDRTLHVIDRSRRQQLMSVGAAIYNLRVALRRFGHDATLTIFPDKGEPDLVARFGLGGVTSPSPLDIDMFRAIPLRRTNRQAYAQRPVSHRLVDELARLAEFEGASLTRLHARAKAALAEVITAADRVQFGDPEFRRELSEWLVPWGSRRKDGIPFARKEYGSRLPVGPFVVRTFDIGDRVAAKERELATGSPALVVLSTAGDEREDWVATGQALEAVLLRAVTMGLSASFLNQPLELDALRPRVSELTGGRGIPQLVLRMGFGPPVPEPTPRRRVEDVLLLD